MAFEECNLSGMNARASVRWRKFHFLAPHVKNKNCKTCKQTWYPQRCADVARLTNVYSCVFWTAFLCLKRPKAAFIARRQLFKLFLDGNPGPAVMRDDSCSRDCEFESQCCIFWVAIFSHQFDVKIEMLFEKPKRNKKEAGDGPFRKSSIGYQSFCKIMCLLGRFYLCSLIRKKHTFLANVNEMEIFVPCY